MPQRIACEAGGARDDNRSVKLIGEPQRCGIIPVEPELKVRDPRWLSQVSRLVADQPAPGQPPVRNLGGEHLRQMREQPGTRYFIVVEIEDPALSTLCV